MSACTRRHFLLNTAIVAASAPLLSRAADQRQWKAAIIGHTGAGDYGHGMDVLFQGRPNIQVVAVADAHEGGRARVAKASGALRQYADYRQMLEKEKPELVSIGPRWTLEHHAMGMAALQAGAHFFIEKPFVHVLAEADEMLAEATKRKRKCVVAHQMRLVPSLVFLKQQIVGGLIGDIIEVNTFGKMDARAGGEDMMVLGSHVFDLIRFFAGDPLWCTARIREQGREATLKDAKESRGEKIGPLLGDEIHAQFGLPNGALATFTSSARLRSVSDGYGMTLTGTKGVVRLRAGYTPLVQLRKRDGAVDAWARLPEDPLLKVAAGGNVMVEANRRLVEDWLQAIEQDREPVASAFNAMKAIEMVMGVYHAGLSGRRVALPLVDRGHPLAAAK
ncbi:MAG: Gfo/Idh/MocA family oxidoreductase [Pedosphaera sp.]|nr:Gfo/Idh/MocA family oxidoreductase [Pedosphaera sp.]MSU44179.1 Gfo/Idh/MocA family oxidoreductase [Pedosphaera sp.]